MYDTGTSSWVELKGYTTPSTTLTYTKTGLTAGTSYTFRVRAQNSFDWGTYSDSVIITASTVPDVISSAVTTTLIGSDVKIVWVAPTSNGATITAYQIVILQSDGTTYSESSYCDGSSSTIVSNMYCNVPITVLRSSPYSLTYGTLIKAKVRAYNSKGW